MTTDYIRATAFAQKVAEQRDTAREEVERLRAEVDVLHRAVASSMERAVKAEQAFALMRELIGVLSNSFDDGDRRKVELRSIYNSTALPIVAKAKGEEP